MCAEAGLAGLGQASIQGQGNEERMRRRLVLMRKGLVGAAGGGGRRAQARGRVEG